MTNWFIGQTEVNLALQKKMPSVNRNLSDNEYLSHLVNLADELEDDMRENILPVINQSVCLNAIDIAFSEIDWFYVVRQIVLLPGDDLPEDRPIGGFCNDCTAAFARAFSSNSVMQASWKLAWGDKERKRGKSQSFKIWYEGFLWFAISTGTIAPVYTPIIEPSLQCINWQELVDFIDERD